MEHPVQLALIAYVGAIGVALLWWALTRCGPDKAVRVGAVALTVTSILAVTLARYGLPTDVSLYRAVHWVPGGWQRFSSGLGGNAQVWLNIALFVPAGVALTLATRRPFVVFVVLVAMSAAIEAIQGLLDIGWADTGDVASNGVGALLGISMACAVRVGVRRGRLTVAASTYVP